MRNSPIDEEYIYIYTYINVVCYKYHKYRFGYSTNWVCQGGVKFAKESDLEVIELNIYII